MAHLNCILFGEDPVERERLDALLERTGHVQVQARVERSQDLAEVKDLLDADLVVASLAERGDAVLDAIEALEQPRPAVILVGPPEKSDWILRAMRIGAREYLAPDLDIEGLGRVIDSLTLTPMIDKDARVAPIIGVFGAKGGVGTTVVACQLAASLQASGQKTCIVDLNLKSGDVALHYDVQPRYSLADIARNEGSIDASYLHSVIETHAAGVSVLAAPLQPEDSELVQPHHVERSLALLRGEFDAIVVDLPAHWDDASLRVLDMSTLLYMVYSFDLPALAHARDQLKLIARLGVEPSRVRLLVNRSDTKGGVRPREAAEFLGRSDDARIGSDYTAVMDAIATGLPLGTAAPRSVLNGAFADLSRDALEHCGIEIEETPQAGRFAKIRKLIGKN